MLLLTYLAIIIFLIVIHHPMSLASFRHSRFIYRSTAIGPCVNKRSGIWYYYFQLVRAQLNLYCLFSDLSVLPSPLWSPSAIYDIWTCIKRDVPIFCIFDCCISNLLCCVKTQVTIPVAYVEDCLEFLAVNECSVCTVIENRSESFHKLGDAFRNHLDLFISLNDSNILR
jgi:hypothetical protein